MEKNKNGLVAFALLGLAIGTAAYYLLGTEDGKRQLDRANEGVRNLTKTIKELSEKEAKRAAKLAKSAKSDIENLKNRAKHAGKEVLDKASVKANEWASRTSEAADNIVSKTEDLANKAKSDIKNV